MSNRLQYENVEAKSILNAVKAPSMPFEGSINPYRGCQHGCSFCYARKTHGFLGMDTDDTFQHHILIKNNAADVLERQLRQWTKKSGPRRIALGTATDPYQPVEGKARITRECLEVLARHQVPVSITTRSPLIMRDMDLLMKLPMVSVNISINTLNREHWRRLEPSSPFPTKRMETVQRLNEAGIPTGVFLAPIIPYITDGRDELNALVQQAANARAKFVMSSFLRLDHPDVKNWFFSTLRLYYPQLVPKYADLYYRSSRVHDEYRQPLRDYIQALLRQYGLNNHEHALHETMSNEAKSVPLQTGEKCGEVPEQLCFTF